MNGLNLDQAIFSMFVTEMLYHILHSDSLNIYTYIVHSINIYTHIFIQEQLKPFYTLLFTNQGLIKGLSPNQGLLYTLLCLIVFSCKSCLEKIYIVNIFTKNAADFLPSCLDAALHILAKLDSKSKNNRIPEN